MPDPRFLQIHFLAPYTAALLNRDDSGLAKRLPYGGAMRTRISSQCLKRHWRIADDPHALSQIEGIERIDGKDAFRSRDLVTRKVIDSLRSEYDNEVVDALNQWFQFAVYSGNSKEKPKKRGQPAKTDSKDGRPTLLFGAPEIAWLQHEFRELAHRARDEHERPDPDKAFKLGEEWVGLKKKGKSNFQKNREENLKALLESCKPPAGLTGALFGRMVTSDPNANITAPVHVAHAFTVHEEEDESDYFVAVDDLASDDETGADTIQETELTSGLYYGYVVVDISGLIDNLDGNRQMAGEVLHNLVYLIAEVSPGAKLGSTAPYSRATLMLLEAGDRQPRSLAEAFRTPCAPETGAAIAALSSHLKQLDETYATGEERRFMALSNHDLPNATRGNLAELAAWVRMLPTALEA